jgi:hypothetical protein
VCWVGAGSMLVAARELESACQTVIVLQQLTLLLSNRVLPVWLAGTPGCQCAELCLPACTQSQHEPVNMIVNCVSHCC